MFRSNETVFGGMRLSFSRGDGCLSRESREKDAGTAFWATVPALRVKATRLRAQAESETVLDGFVDLGRAFDTTCTLPDGENRRIVGQQVIHDRIEPTQRANRFASRMSARMPRRRP